MRMRRQSGRKKPIEQCEKKRQKRASEAFRATRPHTTRKIIFGEIWPRGCVTNVNSDVLSFVLTCMTLGMQRTSSSEESSTSTEGPSSLCLSSPLPNCPN